MIRTVPRPDVLLGPGVPVTKDWFDFFSTLGNVLSGPRLSVDPDLSRITFHNVPPKFDLAGGILAVDVLHNPASITLGVGQNYWLQRMSLDSGGFIPCTIGQNSVVAGFGAFLEATAGSHASSALYQLIGSVQNKGPGTAKSVYGRAVGATGCTGVVVGLVGAVDWVSGMGTGSAIALQLDCSTGPDDIAVMQVWDASGGARIQAGITSLAAIKYNAVAYRAWMHSGSAAGATAFDIYDETPTRLAYVGKIGDAHFPSLEVTGGQITFPASQNASADAHTLDDYEEGTFTPAITFGGGSTGITYSTQTGKYTKVGNVVHYWINLVLTSKGSSAGAALVTALPFTSADNAVAAFSGNNFAAGSVAFFEGFVNSGATTINLSRYSAGTASGLSDTDFTNTSILRIAGSYPV